MKKHLFIILALISFNHIYAQNKFDINHSFAVNYTSNISKIRIKQINGQATLNSNTKFGHKIDLDYNLFFNKNMATVFSVGYMLFPFSYTCDLSANEYNLIYNYYDYRTFYFNNISIVLSYLYKYEHSNKLSSFIKIGVNSNFFYSFTQNDINFFSDKTEILNISFNNNLEMLFGNTIEIGIIRNLKKKNSLVLSLASTFSFFDKELINYEFFQNSTDYYSNGKLSTNGSYIGLKLGYIFQL